MFIPTVATFMVITSLIHWSIELAQYIDAASWASKILFTGEDIGAGSINAPSMVMLVMLSINVRTFYGDHY